MKDLIERQAAIDAIRASTSKYTGFMEMEMYTDDDAVEAIEGLPSAQPEIIRCKDCKYGVHTGCGNTYLCVVSPEDRLEHKYDFWCAYAERRRDEQTD